MFLIRFFLLAAIPCGEFPAPLLAKKFPQSSGVRACQSCDCDSDGRRQLVEVLNVNGVTWLVINLCYFPLLLLLFQRSPPALCSAPTHWVATTMMIM